MDNNFIYMQVSSDEVTVTGEVTAEGFNDGTWFQVSGVGYTFSREWPKGEDGRDRPAPTPPKTSALAFSKEMDSATSGIFELVKRDDEATVICKFCYTGAKKILTWAQYKFEKCHFTKHGLTGKTESVEFTFHTIEFKFWPRYVHGKKKSARTTAFTNEQDTDAPADS